MLSNRMIVKLVALLGFMGKFLIFANESLRSVT